MGGRGSARRCVGPASVTAGRRADRRYAGRAHDLTWSTGVLPCTCVYATRAALFLPASDAGRPRIDDGRHGRCLVWSTRPPGSRPTARGTTWSTGVAPAGCRGVHASVPSVPYSSPHCLRPQDARRPLWAHTAWTRRRRQPLCGRQTQQGDTPAETTRPPAVQLVAPAACARAARLRQLVQHRAPAAPLLCKDARRPCVCSLIHACTDHAGGSRAPRPSWPCPLRQRGRNWPSCHCQDDVAWDPTTCRAHHCWPRPWWPQPPPPARRRQRPTLGSTWPRRAGGREEVDAAPL